MTHEKSCSSGIITTDGPKAISKLKERAITSVTRDYRSLHNEL